MQIFQTSESEEKYLLNAYELFAGVQADSSFQPEMSSTTTKKGSGADDNFWNAWLPDTGAKAEKKVTSPMVKTCSSSRKLSSSRSSEKLSITEERKSVSKIDSMLENKKRASDKLGLNKSRRKSSYDDDIHSKSQGTAPQVVQQEKEENIKVSAVEIENVFVSSTSEAEVKVETVTDSSTIDTDNRLLKIERHKEDERQENVSCRIPSVKETKEAENMGQVQNERSRQTEIASKNEQDTKVENKEVNSLPEEGPVHIMEERLSADTEHCVQCDTLSDNVEDKDLQQRAESVETKDTESAQENLLISCSQDLTEVDQSIVEREEFAREANERIEEEHTDANNKDITHEAKSEVVEVEREINSADNPAEKANIEASESVETVIEPETAELEKRIEIEEGKQQTQERLVGETISVMEHIANSLSDSKSDGGIMEKVLMQESSESGTTTTSTSDEGDEYNKTLTEEDFKKMGGICAEGENKHILQESDTDQAKSGAETRSEHTRKAASSLTSSGYVKNMIEEAMVESLKESDSHSDRSSDKSSDMVRIESGMNSGHTSGDEIDTTTSSDIEIISTPTPNGEYKIMERPFDLSPLRHALSKTVRRGGSPPQHKRTDSGSSAHSNWSKNGDDLLSPEGMIHKHRDKESSHIHGERYCIESERYLLFI